MQVKQIPKPIILKRSPLGKIYDNFLKDMEKDLPINAWCQQQEIIKKNKKF